MNNYTKPELIIISLDDADVIATSSGEFGNGKNYELGDFWEDNI